MSADHASIADDELRLGLDRVQSRALIAGGVGLALSLAAPG